MPFGQKPAGDGRRVADFDAIYTLLIKPAVEDAGLEPLRADEEQVGGLIHKAMFERLILCEYAVADLTSANANVFYELGVRHATRAWSTQPIFAAGWGQLPFDVNGLRALPYQLGADGRPSNLEQDRTNLSDRLRAAREAKETPSDSPVYQLVEGFPDIQRLKTDVFRDRVRYAEGIKTRLATARKQGVEALAAIEAELGDLAAADAAVVIDLYLSYRAVKAWEPMIALTERMAEPLARTVMVREQRGLALNRAGRGDAAEQELTALIRERGVSSETCGILGRVYKDRWQAALKAGNNFLARGLLDKAIAAYLQGFEADWRDAYPGVNVLTLMELREPPDPRRLELLPVVTYAVRRRIATGQPDYWDHATLLELAVLAQNQEAAEAALADALAAVREKWEPETTANNLALIRAARLTRGQVTDWAEEVEKTLCNS
jgi:tetratricopeptide (TPR) repeat protein